MFLALLNGGKKNLRTLILCWVNQLQTKRLKIFIIYLAAAAYYNHLLLSISLRFACSWMLFVAHAPLGAFDKTSVPKLIWCTLFYESNCSTKYVEHPPKVPLRVLCWNYNALYRVISISGSLNIKTYILNFLREHKVSSSLCFQSLYHFLK